MLGRRGTHAEVSLALRARRCLASIPWSEVKAKEDQAGVSVTSLDLSPQIWSPGTRAWAARPCAWRASRSCLMVHRCATTTCIASTGGPRPDPHTSESSSPFSSWDSLGLGKLPCSSFHSLFWEFSQSVQSLSRVRLFAIPWTAAH